MNNSWVRFDPIFPPAFAFIILALLVFFVYREFQRHQKFLSFRIVALCFIAVSLLGIFLRPGYEVNKRMGVTLLLAKNYDRNKVDSIIRQNPETKIIKTEDAEAYSNSLILKSWYELAEENIFCIVGEGIPHHAIDLIQHQSFRFIPADPFGITSLTLPEVVCENQRQTIHGILNAADKTTLRLFGPGGAEDSVTFDKGENNFALSFTPRQSGLFTYQVESRDVRGVVVKERLPIEVVPERQLRILFLQHYPTAEIRFLKNFLSEKNNQLVLRYKISKNNFTYEFANTSPVRFATLRPDFLNSFDVIVIDQQSYDALTEGEKAEIKRSVQKGLGVIVLLHSPKEKFLQEFRTVEFKVSSKDTATVRLLHPYTLPVLPIELLPDPSIVATAKNKNRILSGYFFVGLGKVGFQFIQETYRLSLEGNKDDYAMLWTPLIQHTSRSFNKAFKLKLATPFPRYPNEPLDIEVISSGANPNLYDDSILVPLKEHATLNDYWSGRSWAGKSGWHKFATADSTDLNYFISNKVEWKSLRAANQIKETTNLQKALSVQPGEKRLEVVAIPRVVFYLLFLFSAGFLWLVPKI